MNITTRHQVFDTCNIWSEGIEKNEEGDRIEKSHVYIQANPFVPSLIVVTGTERIRNLKFI